MCPFDNVVGVDADQIVSRHFIDDHPVKIVLSQQVLLPGVPFVERVLFLYCR
jgi:hypothetical protein